MNFNTRVAAPAAWSQLSCDALIVVSVGDGVPAGLDKTLAAVMSAAMNWGNWPRPSTRCARKFWPRSSC